MTAFADHNKDYFRANYNALREELAKIPTNLEGYSKESLEALDAAKTALNYNLNRNKQAELDTLVANLKAALQGLKPAATHSGSLDENEVAANVETRPELITRTEEIPFEVIKKKILTSQLVRKILSQQESKVNELITSLYSLKMEKQQKQSLIAR